MEEIIMKKVEIIFDDNTFYVISDKGVTAVEAYAYRLPQEVEKAIENALELKAPDTGY